jgi:hypothetical protein
MSEAGNGQAHYRISIPGPVRARIRLLAGKAAALGIQPQFVKALRDINRRLSSEPSSFGELTRRLGPATIEHIGSAPPLTVRFAIHQIERAVFLLQVILRPASL